MRRSRIPPDGLASGTSSLWSGANAKESRTVGAQATFSFSGTSVRWLGERGFSTGLARVSIDGQFVGVVDTRTPFQEEYQEPVFTATGLAPGTHTLTIEIVGRNNEAAGTTVERVVIDAFDILPNNAARTPRVLRGARADSHLRVISPPHHKPYR